MSERVMRRLHRKRMTGREPLPLDRKKGGNDMVAMLKEPIFREVLLSLKTRQVSSSETRGDLIKLIEEYIKHPEIVSPEYDLLLRAKVEGSLLACVLKLLARDRFDPIGCIILAQQDRELQVDPVSSLFQVDLD